MRTGAVFSALMRKCGTIQRRAVRLQNGPRAHRGRADRTSDVEIAATIEIMIVQRYPEPFIAPMRAELTRLGFEELRTPEAVEAAVQQAGTTMVVVNSVCGCAAGKARPGIALALTRGKRPERLTTVFAGADVEATESARAHFAPHAPSSPSIALLKDGKLVYMMERRDIEGRSADMIAEELRKAFELHC